MKPPTRAEVWYGTLAMVTGLLVFAGLAVGAGGVDEDSVLLLRLAPMLLAAAAASDAVRAWVVPRILGARRTLTRPVLGAVLAAGLLWCAVAAPGLSRVVFAPVLTVFAIFY